MSRNAGIALFFITAIIILMGDFYPLSAQNKTQSQEQAKAEKLGGVYGPARTPPGASMRVFIVYAQVKDDKKDPDNPNWKPGSLPKDASSVIGTDIKQAPFPPNSLSNYYYLMSGGKNVITGYVYPELVIIDKPIDTFYGLLNQEVLKIVDEKVDFREFDKWDMTSPGNFNYNKPDGYVDAVYIYFRNLSPKYNWAGIADLGSSYDTKDGVKIGVRIPTLSMTNNTGHKSEYVVTNNIGLVAHEYGHYLFGNGHNFEPEFAHSGSRQRGIGLMPGNSGTVAMNPQEKFLLGYITYHDIFKEQTVTLPDFQTSGIAYRFPIPLYNKDGKPNLNPDEFFVVANHQNITPYEKVRGTGIYVYHIKKNNYAANHMEIYCADGKWQWEFLKWVPTPPGMGGPGDWQSRHSENPEFLPVIVHKKTDRIAGRDELKEVLNIKYKDGVDYWWDRWLDDEGVLQKFPIGSPEDAFNMGYNEIFSPWSNPASAGNYGKPTSFAFRITGRSGNSFTVTFYVDDKSYMKMPPSKPQNLKAAPGKDNHPVLSWEANLEPDMPGKGTYRIFRSQSGDNPANYKPVHTFTPADYNQEFFSWQDNDITLNGSSGNTYHYRISAVDGSKMESVKSEPAKIR